MIARLCNNPACHKVIMKAYNEAEVDISDNWPKGAIQIKGKMIVHGGENGTLVTQDVDYCNAQCLAADINGKAEEFDLDI